jgi:hypothetical protein
MLDQFESWRVIVLAVAARADAAGPRRANDARAVYHAFAVASARLVAERLAGQRVDGVALERAVAEWLYSVEATSLATAAGIERILDGQ